MPDDQFPSFVALPPANRFTRTGVGGALLAAADRDSNLLIPFDFSAFVTTVDSLTQFLDIAVPALAGHSGLRIDSFTPEGRPLPPLIHRVGDMDLVGTADAPASVLRVERGAVDRPGPADGGPVVISDVTASAEAGKRANPLAIRRVHARRRSRSTALTRRRYRDSPREKRRSGRDPPCISSKPPTTSWRSASQS